MSLTTSHNSALSGVETDTSLPHGTALQLTVDDSSVTECVTHYTAC